MRLNHVIDENKPSQQGSLNVQRRLELAMAEAGNDTEHNLSGNPGDRIEVSDKGSKACLVEMTWCGDKVDQIIEGTGEQAAVVSERNEGGNRRLDTCVARLGWSLGSIDNILHQVADLAVGWCCHFHSCE